MIALLLAVAVPIRPAISDDGSVLRNALIGYGLDPETAECPAELLPGKLSAKQIEHLAALPELPTHEANPADDFPWRLMALNDRAVTLAFSEVGTTCLQRKLDKR